MDKEEKKPVMNVVRDSSGQWTLNILRPQEIREATRGINYNEWTHTSTTSNTSTASKLRRSKSIGSRLLTARTTATTEKQPTLNKKTKNQPSKAVPRTSRRGEIPSLSRASSIVSVLSSSDQPSPPSLAESNVSVENARPRRSSTLNSFSRSINASSTVEPVESKREAELLDMISTLQKRFDQVDRENSRLRAKLYEMENNRLKHQEEEDRKMKDVFEQKLKEITSKILQSAPLIEEFEELQIKNQALEAALKQIETDYAVRHAKEKDRYQKQEKEMMQKMVDLQTKLMRSTVISNSQS